MDLPKNREIGELRTCHWGYLKKSLNVPLHLQCQKCQLWSNMALSTGGSRQANGGPIDCNTACSCIHRVPSLWPPICPQPLGATPPAETERASLVLLPSFSCACWQLPDLPSFRYQISVVGYFWPHISALKWKYEFNPVFALPSQKLSGPPRSKALLKKASGFQARREPSPQGVSGLKEANQGPFPGTPPGYLLPGISTSLYVEWRTGHLTLKDDLLP